MPDHTSLPLAHFDIAQLTPDGVALFLDLDGTLAEIVEHPDAIVVPSPVIEALELLQQTLDGALAIVSGRELRDVERHIGGGIICIAGIHGLQRRDARGERHDTEVDEAALATLATLVSDAAAPNSGLHLETKPASVALHYRRRPDLEDYCRSLAHEVTAKVAGTQIVHGKMVVEVKLNGVHKGDAVRAFMNESPFDGRRPVYAGDDITDQDAFKAVRFDNGISIAVGNGAAGADYRVDDPGSFNRWLINLSRELSQGTLKSHEKVAAP